MDDIRPEDYQPPPPPPPPPPPEEPPPPEPESELLEVMFDMVELKELRSVAKPLRLRSPGVPTYQTGVRVLSFS